MSIPSPLGQIILAGDEELTGLWFEGQAHFGLSPDIPQGEFPAFRQTARWLKGYFSGREPGEAPPVRLTGTAFQERVWAELMKIPRGSTVTYGQLARALGNTSARAVGGAVGRDPVSVIVPCHRVLGAGGRLTGYAGGLERKRRLLALEGIML